MPLTLRHIVIVPRKHDHYCEDADHRWVCGDDPCIKHGAAPCPQHPVAPSTPRRAS
jgi:hypothetical protein